MDSESTNATRAFDNYCQIHSASAYAAVLRLQAILGDESASSSAAQLLRLICGPYHCALRLVGQTGDRHSSNTNFAALTYDSGCCSTPQLVS
jgi:hypothetical protein